MKSLLLIGLTVFSLSKLTIDATVAQTNSPAPPPIPHNPMLPLVQAAPLVQATSKLLSQSSYQLESEIELTDKVTNVPLSKARIITTVAAPNKVNAEITFIERDKLLDQKYQIISDGIKVWIYDVDKNQYSVGKYQQFIQSQQGLAVGLLSNFYLKTLNGVNNNRLAANTLKTLPPARVIRYFQQFAHVDLQNMVIRSEQIESETYAVYDIDAADDSYRVTTYVAPSANIEQIDLSATKDGLELVVRENIVAQTVPESNSWEIFNFVPPEDVEQIPEQIAIEPF